MPSQRFYKPTKEKYPGSHEQEHHDAVEHDSQNGEESFALLLNCARDAYHQTHKVNDRSIKPAKHDDDEEDFIVRLIVNSAIAYSRDRK